MRGRSRVQSRTVPPKGARQPMSDHLPTLEPYTDWNASYLWARSIKPTTSHTSRAYVTKAGNVKIRPGSQPGSTRSHRWQWDAYAAAMQTGEWDAHDRVEGPQALAERFARRTRVAA